MGLESAVAETNFEPVLRYKKPSSGPTCVRSLKSENHFTLLTKTAVVRAGMVAVPSFALKVD